MMQKAIPGKIPLPVGLTGGYLLGDIVFSKIDWSDNRDGRYVKVGDPGEVLGPGRWGLDLSLSFPNAASMNMKSHEIGFAGGYSPGDIVYSKIDWEGKDGRSVKAGDKGVVVGSANCVLLVKFPKAANLSVDSSEISLIGGYSPGDVVFSQIQWKGGKGDKRRVQVWDKGVILGSATVKSRELSVRFPKAALLNVMLSEISLAGGYLPGDVIYSKINWKGTYSDRSYIYSDKRRVKSGEKGKVLGPATLEARDLLVAFPNAATLNVDLTEVSTTVNCDIAKVGRFTAGDVVCSLITWSGGKGDKRRVNTGDKGVVLGPAIIKAMDVLVKFPHAAKLNVMHSEIAFVGGYMPGDAVRSKINWRGTGEDKRSVKVGDKGEILGSSTLDGRDLVVKFPRAARLNVSISEISPAYEPICNTIAEPDGLDMADLMVEFGNMSVSPAAQECIHPVRRTPVSVFDWPYSTSDSDSD